MRTRHNRHSSRQRSRGKGAGSSVTRATEEADRSWIRAASGEWCRRWLHRLRDCACPEGERDRRWWARQPQSATQQGLPSPSTPAPAEGLKFSRTTQAPRRRGRPRVETSGMFMQVVCEIHTALTLAREWVQVWDHELRRAVRRQALIGQTFSGDPARPESWTSVAGPPTPWDRYRLAHQRGVGEESRTAACQKILDEILERCPTVTAMVKEDPDLPEDLLWALTLRRGVGGGRESGRLGTRAHHESPESLTRTLTILLLNRSEKTLRRRVLFEAGHISFGNFDPNALSRDQGKGHRRT